MRKIVVSMLLFLFIFQSLSFALTQNEIKYKWDKLGLVTITRSELTPTYKRYMSGYFSDAKPKIMAARGEEIEKWYIIKGGQPISDVAFLQIMGENKRAGTIQTTSLIGGTFDFIGRSFFFGGLVHWLCNGQYAWMPNEQEAGRGTQAMAVGAALWLLNPFKPKDNYVPYDEAGYKIDLYNLKLRRELGLEN
ncbi:MAG: hypothetical protein V3T21_00285 [Candidatus Margulisiibacteriota bacterium]